MTDFKLTTAERHSACWVRMKAHLEERLNAHRRKNDGNLSMEETARLRGRIADTLYVLSLGIAENDLPEPVAENGE